MSDRIQLGAARLHPDVDRYERMLRAEGLGAIVGPESTRRVNARRSEAVEAAEFWAVVGAQVADLPRSYSHRKFLVALAGEGNLSKAARDYGLTRDAARWVFKRFLERIGLGQSRPARSKYSGPAPAGAHNWDAWNERQRRG